MRNAILQIGRRLIPERLLQWLYRQWYLRTSLPVGSVNWGDLRRRKPISQVWPNYRGQPIDRYYIEKFLSGHAADINGHLLELGDATYTRLFGGDRVTEIDVLHGRPGNPTATIVADLTKADQIPSDRFDCIILTQTLLLIYDLQAAVQTLHRILKPGGVLLVTLPGITQIIRGDMEEYGQYWSFTEQSAQRLFADRFGGSNVSTRTYGNVQSAAGFLYGMATQELSKEELDHHDPDYQLIIGVRVCKVKP
jgi:SAM-dependent methyltransferase